MSSIQKASRWTWELAVLDSSKTTFRGKGEEDCRTTHLCSNPRLRLHSETPSLNKTNQMRWEVCLGIDITRSCMELMNWLVSGPTEESMLASLCVRSWEMTKKKKKKRRDLYVTVPRASRLEFRVFLPCVIHSSALAVLFTMSIFWSLCTRSQICPVFLLLEILHCEVNMTWSVCVDKTVQKVWRCCAWYLKM